MYANYKYMLNFFATPLPCGFLRTTTGWDRELNTGDDPYALGRTAILIHGTCNNII
jgi:hypothetical protein